MITHDARGGYQRHAFRASITSNSCTIQCRLIYVRSKVASPPGSLEGTLIKRKYLREAKISKTTYGKQVATKLGSVTPIAPHVIVLLQHRYPKRADFCPKNRLG